jgi:hypothetical protein
VAFHRTSVSLNVILCNAPNSDIKVNLELSLHRLHLESAAADAQRHVAVLAVSQMGETERMVRQA